MKPNDLTTAAIRAIIDKNSSALTEILNTSASFAKKAYLKKFCIDLNEVYLYGGENNHSKSLLSFSIAAKNFDAFKSLISLGASIEVSDTNHPVDKSFLTHNDVNYSHNSYQSNSSSSTTTIKANFTPLYISIHHDHQDFTKALLLFGADIEAKMNFIVEKSSSHYNSQSPSKSFSFNLDWYCSFKKSRSCKMVIESYRNVFFALSTKPTALNQFTAQQIYILKAFELAPEFVISFLGNLVNQLMMLKNQKNTFQPSYIKAFNVPVFKLFIGEIFYSLNKASVLSGLTDQQKLNGKYS